MCPFHRPDVHTIGEVGRRSSPGLAERSWDGEAQSSLRDEIDTSKDTVPIGWAEDDEKDTEMVLTIADAGAESRPPG